MIHHSNIEAVGQNACSAALTLSGISDQVISETLVIFSRLIQKNQARILKANSEDIELARQNNTSKASIDRLMLNEERINYLKTVMFDVAQQKSPVDRILETVTRPNGLQIKKITTPIGVVLYLIHI